MSIARYLLLSFFVVSTIFAQSISEFKLLPNDGSGGEEFGISVAIHENYAIVGAWLDGDNGVFSGSAYIFERSGESWIQKAKLVPEELETTDNFGVAVGIHGDYAVVGAPQDDDAGENAGAAYVFKRADGDWILDTKLTANDAIGFDLVGVSVDISSEYIICGATEDWSTANGKAYVYQLSDGVWVQRSKLTAFDGDDEDDFGHAVAITDEFALVGAWHHNTNDQPWQGKAYFFERGDLGGFTEMGSVEANDGDDHDLFGASVDLDGEFAIIGAPSDEPGGLASGSAYIFEFNGSNWVQRDKLVPDDDEPAGDKFGGSVKMEGLTAIIGASEDEDNGISSGTAYIFMAHHYSPTNWEPYAEYYVAQGDDLDRFATSVGMSSGRFIAGAFQDDVQGFNAGAAYVLADDSLTFIGTDIALVPRSAMLFQNYPNPFNPSTVISYQLSQPSDISLDIYDISGRLVRNLVSGFVSSGAHEVEWNGTNEAGKRISSGVYLYQLRTTNGFTKTKKLMMLN